MMVVFFSPPPRENKVDGYFARVQEIDQIFSGIDKVYIEVTGRFDHFKVNQLGNTTWHLKISREYANTKEFWDLLSEISQLIYFHSIYNVAEVVSSLKWLPAEKSVLDIHGVVPEEFESENNFNEAMRFSDIEKEALSSIKKVVTVSEQMQKHLEKKYSASTFEFILLPTLKNIHLNSKFNYEMIGNKLAHLSEPRIAYIGGMQKWQKTDTVINFIKQNSKFKFKIFSADYIAFRKLTSGLKNIIDCRYLPEELLAEEYKNIHYSFVLRDKHILNQVSCPTKLIDAITYYTIPIFDSNEIGDFLKYDLKYLSINNMDNVEMMNPESYRDMVSHNHKILIQLRIIYQEAQKQLRKFISNESDSSVVNKFAESVEVLSRFHISNIKVISSRFLSLRLKAKISVVIAKFKLNWNF